MVCIFSVRRTMLSIDVNDELNPCTNCGFCETKALGPNMFDITTEACVKAKYQRPGLKFCGQKKNQQRVSELEKEIREMEWRLKDKKFALSKMNRA